MSKIFCSSRAMLRGVFGTWFVMLALVAQATPSSANYQFALLVSAATGAAAKSATAAPRPLPMVATFHVQLPGNAARQLNVVVDIGSSSNSD